MPLKGECLPTASVFLKPPVLEVIEDSKNIHIQKVLKRVQWEALSFQREPIHPVSFPRQPSFLLNFQNTIKEANAEVLQLQKLTRPYKFHCAATRNPTHLNISNLSLTTTSPVNKTICSTSFLYLCSRIIFHVNSIH